MKQMIVLISSIVLGIALGVMILGFEDVSENLVTAATGKLTALQSQF